ncbi:MAG: hypothetical protein DMG01_26220 [Acidobacteria bacterium]|nr:MAG: hypothetical protein DMG01_26220 [Acidobacteriota bacterium]
MYGLGEPSRRTACGRHDVERGDVLVLLERRRRDDIRHALAAGRDPDIHDRAQRHQIVDAETCLAGPKPLEILRSEDWAGVQRHRGDHGHGCREVQLHAFAEVYWPFR